MFEDQLEVETAVYDALATMRRNDRHDIAMFLIDPVVLNILAATYKRCLTVSEMALMVNLPAATCYKLVYQMERLGLIACCGSGRTSGHGKALVYTSVLKEMSLDMKNCALGLSVTWKNGVIEDLRQELTLQLKCHGQTPQVGLAGPVLGEKHGGVLSSD